MMELYPHLKFENIDEIILIPHTNGNIINGNGYSPQMIREVYGIKEYIPKNGIPNISIIACYYYQNLQQDFDTWTNFFGLPNKKLNIINLSKNNFTDNNNNYIWNLEICLDVQAVYTVSPNSNIYVIFSDSSSLSSMKLALIEANKILNNTISMSFGTYKGYETDLFESLFLSKNNSYIASTGDNNNISYPATSPNVLSVGGTSLIISKDNKRISETTWEKAGCGFSSLYYQPKYQSNIDILVGKMRAVPDVCSIANPKNGLIIYCSSNKNNNPWKNGFGTSLSAPLISGLISNANILRYNLNKSSLTTIGDNSIQFFIYNLLNLNIYNNIFYDIKKGLDGNFKSNIGYDIATGMGTPNYDDLINKLIEI